MHQNMELNETLNSQSDLKTTRLFENDDLECTNHHSMDKAATIFMVTFISISVVGVLGNIFSVRLLRSEQNAKNKIVSKVYTVYITALAIADSGMLIFFGVLKYVVVTLLYNPKNADYFYEIYICRWHRFLMHGFHSASGWLLVCMTFDRFMAVCFPLKYRLIHKGSKFAKKLVVAVYCFSFLFASPFISVGPIYDEINNSSVVIGCSLLSTLSTEQAYVINVLCHVIISIILPYILLLIFSISILHALHCRRIKRRNSGSQAVTRLSRRITIMMLAVCSSYIFLWAPQLVTLLNHSDAHSHACEGDYLIRSIAILLAVSNSSLNFFLYCMTVKKFREATLAYFTCQTEVKPSETTHHILYKKPSQKLLKCKMKENKQSRILIAPIR